MGLDRRAASTQLRQTGFCANQLFGRVLQDLCDSYSVNTQPQDLLG